jgi:hypothetical protein
MIHYSCDRCKRRLDGQQDMRFSVRIDAQAALEPHHMHEPAEDRDYLDELQELIEEAADIAGGDAALGLPIQRRFDLCRDCYVRFLRNPLGEPAAPVGFSSN